MSTQATLCQPCQAALGRLKIGVERQYDGNTTHGHCSWDVIHRTAFDGCPMCSIAILQAHEKYHSLFQVLKSISDLPTPRPLKIVFSRWYISLEVGIEIQFQDEKLSEPIRYNVMLQQLESETWPISYEPTYSTADPETMRLIQQWSSTCLSTHKYCNGTERNSWAPSRLLELSSEEGEVRIKLVEFSLGHYDKDVQYVTLSHRWARVEPLQLLSSTRWQLMREVPQDRLKQAVTDAVDVALRLGVRYIWIDTLCIIQDDRNDKAREISNMHNVYGHSWCTIAAAVPDEAGAGCYTYRSFDDLTLAKAYKVQINVGSRSIPYRLRLQWCLTKLELEHCSLGSRAWIYQERFLSSRLIHFCKQRVHWECREHEASETYPDGKPIGDVVTVPNRPFLELDEDPDTGKWIHNSECTVPFWKEVVEAYTQLDLTVPEDRLHGVAGVAAYCRDYYDDQDVSGLFSKTFMVDLLWYVTEGLRRGSKSKKKTQRLPGIAPTWSWASVDNSVTYGWSWKAKDACAELVPSIADCESPKPVGEGIIRLRGRPFSRTLNATGSGCGHFKFATNTKFRGQYGKDQNTIFVLLDCEDVPSQSFEAEFLPIMRSKHTDGLVLRLCEQDPQPIYERVGFWETNGQSQGSEERDLMIC